MEWQIIGDYVFMAPTVLGNSPLYPSWVLVLVFGKVEWRFAGVMVQLWGAKTVVFSGEGGSETEITCNSQLVCVCVEISLTEL
jgi:hypothetical protein